MTIQAAIDAAADGTPGAPTVVDLSGVSETTEETIQITGRHHLHIVGAELTSVTDGSAAAPYSGGSANWPRSRSHFRVFNSTDITLDGLRVNGPHPNAGTNEDAQITALEAQHAYEVGNSTGVRIIECSAFDVYGDLLYLNGTDITVDGGEFRRCGRQGVAITNATDVTVSNTTISDIRRSAVDLESNLSSSDEIRRIVIECNTFERVRLNVVAAGGAGAPMSDIYFVGNTMLGADGMQFLKPSTGNPRRRVAIIGNTSVWYSGTNGGAFVNFNGVEDCWVADNVINFNPNQQMIGVKFRDGSNGCVGLNDFVGLAATVDTDETSTWEEITAVELVQRYQTADGARGMWMPYEPPEPPEPPPSYPADITVDDAAGTHSGFVTSPADGAVWDLTGAATRRP